MFAAIPAELSGMLTVMASKASELRRVRKTTQLHPNTLRR